MAELPFPIFGLHKGVSAEHQPPLTTPHAQNVRAFDVEVERNGGQRGGFVKAHATQIGGARPVILIDSITSTYIDPD